MIILIISIFGGAGAIARFIGDGLLRTLVGRRFPWSTMIINIIGSFILGLITGFVLSGGSANLGLIIGTGFCGGFTTFSTASFEIARLLEEHRYGASIFSVVFSVGSCLLAGFVGMVLLV